MTETQSAEFKRLYIESTDIENGFNANEIVKFIDRIVLDARE